MPASRQRTIELTEEGQQVHDAEEGHDVQIDAPHQLAIGGVRRANKIVAIVAVGRDVERTVGDLDFLVDAHLEESEARSCVEGEQGAEVEGEFPARSRGSGQGQAPL